MLDLLTKDQGLNEESEVRECRGVYYRGSCTVYLGSRNTLVRKQSIKKLVRMSCPGCRECGMLWDSVQDLPDHVVWPEVVEHGALYKLVITNESTDWETGIMDDWDIEIRKVDKSPTE